MATTKRDNRDTFDFDILTKSKGRVYVTVYGKISIDLIVTDFEIRVFADDMHEHELFLGNLYDIPPDEWSMIEDTGHTLLVDDFITRGENERRYGYLD